MILDSNNDAMNGQQLNAPNNNKTQKNSMSLLSKMVASANQMKQQNTNINDNNNYINNNSNNNVVNRPKKKKKRKKKQYGLNQPSNVIMNVNQGNNINGQFNNNISNNNMNPNNNNMFNVQSNMQMNNQYNYNNNPNVYYASYMHQSNQYNNFNSQNMPHNNSNIIQRNRQNAINPMQGNLALQLNHVQANEVRNKFDQKYVNKKQDNSGNNLIQFRQNNMNKYQVNNGFIQNPKTEAVLTTIEHQQPIQQHQPIHINNNNNMYSNNYNQQQNHYHTQSNMGPVFNHFNQNKHFHTNSFNNFNPNSNNGNQDDYADIPSQNMLKLRLKVSKSAHNVYNPHTFDMEHFKRGSRSEHNIRKQKTVVKNRKKTKKKKKKSSDIANVIYQANNKPNKKRIKKVKVNSKLSNPVPKGKDVISFNPLLKVQAKQKREQQKKHPKSIKIQDNDIKTNEPGTQSKNIKDLTSDEIYDKFKHLNWKNLKSKENYGNGPIDYDTFKEYCLFYGIKGRIVAMLFDNIKTKRRDNKVNLIDIFKWKDKLKKNDIQQLIDIIKRNDIKKLDLNDSIRNEEEQLSFKQPPKVFRNNNNIQSIGSSFGSPASPEIDDLFGQYN